MGDIIFPNLGITVKGVERVFISIGGFNIYWYGVFIGLGALLGILLCFKEAKRTGQSQNVYSDFAFVAILSGIVCARIYYLVFHGDSLLEFFRFRDGGLAIYGGIIGGIVSAIIFSKIKKIPIFKLADTCVMSVLVGQIFGRWGNFFNREAFGGYTDGLFAMALNVEDVNGLKVIGNVGRYLGKTDYPISVINGLNYIQVHPTFLYESFWNTLLLGIIFASRKNKKFDGQLTTMYFIGYGLGRFVIESLRTDQLMIGPLPVSMIVSGCLVIAGIVLTALLIKKEA